MDFNPITNIAVEPNLFKVCFSFWMKKQNRKHAKEKGVALKQYPFFENFPL